MAQQTYIARKGQDADFADITVDSITIAGAAVDTAVLLASGQAVDLNGETGGIVFDADANSKIYPSADDEITINIGGASDFKIAANTLTALSGSTIATNTIAETTATNGVVIDSLTVKDGGATLGTGGVFDLNGEADALVLDADGDTSISAPTANQIDIEINNADDFTFTANTFTALSGSTIATNTIAETTAGSGVTIDGALLKDGRSNLGRQVQAITASEAITIKSGLVTLAHDTVAIAATLAAPTAGDDLWIVDSSASGTAAHTVKTAAGVTLDGTNNTATLNAPDEALHILALSATRWYIATNNGSVGLSST